MAEITESKSPGQKTKRRPIKKILRPDLTAMVDVAFLLLTFFVMTSHMQNEENSVVLDLPDPNAGKTDTKAEKLLTLIPAENDRLFYYFGTGEKGLHPTEYGAAGLRTLILGHLNPKGMKLCSDMKTTNCWDPVFIIKARKKARYKNLIEVLDEMKITRAKKYAVSEFGQKDSLIWIASGF